MRRKVPESSSITSAVAPAGALTARRIVRRKHRDPVALRVGLAGLAGGASSSPGYEILAPRRSAAGWERCPFGRQLEQARSDRPTSRRSPRRRAASRARKIAANGRRRSCDAAHRCGRARPRSASRVPTERRRRSRRGRRRASAIGAGGRPARRCTRCGVELARERRGRRIWPPRVARRRVSHRPAPDPDALLRRRTRRPRGACRGLGGASAGRNSDSISAILACRFLRRLIATSTVRFGLRLHGAVERGESRTVDLLAKGAVLGVALFQGVADRFFDRIQTVFLIAAVRVADR